MVSQPQMINMRAPYTVKLLTYIHTKNEGNEFLQKFDLKEFRNTKIYERLKYDLKKSQEKMMGMFQAPPFNRKRIKDLIHLSF